MIGLPQIRLRSVFLLFFCAAVGLATVRDLLGALGPAIATAMVIGLLQQVRELRRWKPSAEPPSNPFTFARRLAIGWRCSIAAIIALFLVAALIELSGVLQFENEERVLLHFHFIYPIETICVTIVLCNSVMRWRPTVLSRPRHSRWQVLLWLISIPMIAMVVIFGGLSTFLSHQALAEIEAFRPQFRRPGVYINLRDQGYLSLWLAIAAVAALIAGGVALIRFVRKRNLRSASFWELVLFILLLAVPVAFCGWYYSIGFHRLSPDLAGVGLHASWVDWLVGLLLCFGLIAIGSYHVARCGMSATVSADLSQDIDSTAFHETVPCLLLIATSAFYAIGILVMGIADANSSVSSILGRQTFWSFLSLFLYPPTLLTLAQAIASLQLCRVRWRQRSHMTIWELRGVSRMAFFQSSLAIAALLLVGIPTLNAFAFLAWIGPWNLMPLLGF